MTTSITIYNQDVVCKDNTTNQNIVHDNIWKPYIINECPNNDPNHTYIEAITLGLVSSSNTFVTNEIDETGGKYRNQQFNMNVPAGPSTGYPLASTKVFPYNVRIAAYEMIPTVDNVGDSFCIYITPPSPTGVTTSDVSSGNVIPVNSNVIINISLGMEVILDDSVDTQNLGECLSVDLINQTITVENDVSKTYITGTAVILRSPIAKNIEIMSDSPIKFGTKMPGNKLILKNYIVELCYNNLSENAKVAKFRAEMLI